MRPASPVLFHDAPAQVEPLRGWIEPLQALRAVRNAPRPALLLSGLESHHAARYSILAWDPIAEISVREGAVAWRSDRDRDSVAQTLSVSDPVGTLRSLLPVSCPTSGDLPFTGGAIGWFGYGLRTAVERVPRAAPDPLRQPDAWWGVYDAALVFDHRRREMCAVIAPIPETPPAGERRGASRRREILEAVGRARLLPSAAREPAPGSPIEGRFATPRAEYMERVARALELIAAGDLYQVNLSHRISAPLADEPIDLFLRLMDHNPAPFSAYIDSGPIQIVCASPERLVSLKGDEVRSSPIKGTRPRGATVEEDRALARDLTSSPKERAENVMIADLVRNDLGKVAVPGSVTVSSLCGLESFATVHHLVTDVVGRLRREVDRFDVIRALFPGGSMTGAPKVRAMEVIAALEGEERGAYSGSLGYLSRDGGLDLNVVIRTVVCGPGGAFLRVGGGIVADSDPAAEYRETLDKAGALLRALRVELSNAG